MRSTAVFPALALAAALAAVGCESTTAPKGTRAIGILEWVQDASNLRSASLQHPDHMVVAPDTVQAGVPFTASVTTLGPTSCWRADGAQVQAGASLAVVTPYDHTDEGEGIACATMVVDLPRTVELSFSARGEAVLRVVGRRVVGQNFDQATEMVVEKRIHVR